MDMVEIDKRIAEKEIAKSPKRRERKNGGVIYEVTHQCPDCNLGVKYLQSYCAYCGKAISWKMYFKPTKGGDEHGH